MICIGGPKHGEDVKCNATGYICQTLEPNRGYVKHHYDLMVLPVGEKGQQEVLIYRGEREDVL